MCIIHQTVNFFLKIQTTYPMPPLLKLLDFVLLQHTECFPREIHILNILQIRHVTLFQSSGKTSPLKNVIVQPNEWTQLSSPWHENKGAQEARIGSWKLVLNVVNRRIQRRSHG